MCVQILLSVDSSQGADASRKCYTDAVEAAGGIAVAEYCPEFSLDYDGLLLCGGCDMDPAYYGEPINGSVDIDRKRDELEMKLADAYIRAGKPVFGICRGFQLLNVYFGGTLQQDIDDVATHRSTFQNYAIHNVTAPADSLPARLYGTEFTVNSCHHQGIKDLADGLTPVAHHNGLVEAFIHTSLPVFGVQWHPEKLCCSMRRDDAVDGMPMFTYFLSLCKGVHK